MRYDVAIIGAGMSGLAAGLRLAQFGRSVVIVERHGMWGGLNSFYKKDGYRFDVGLHAVTNALAPGYRGPRIPLQRIYRQLRLDPDLFALDPQGFSMTVFDDARLRFSNGLELLTQEIAERFPSEIDGFHRLSARCAAYPDSMVERPFVSTRAVLADFIRDPLLVDMLLCPLLYYGSAHENDVDFDQFTILFNSIYREGFCRPKEGVRRILDVLVSRFRESGGRLLRSTPVEAIEVQDGRVAGLRLEDGGVVSADVVLSSAGLLETMALRTDADRAPPSVEAAGELSFIETIWVLDRPAKDLGWEASVAFFNHGERFLWRRPDAFVDDASGVICCPGNYQHDEAIDPPLLRATHLANHRAWFSFDDAAYIEAKREALKRSESAVASIAGPFAHHAVYRDMFTPKTVTKFTGHRHGAVYGTPDKRRTGRTDLDNLFITGTDQGFVGIVGAMLSGIAIANAYVLSARGGEGA
ncbi:MAG: NAD(P)/FAD-dependent oxidoreductase [Deltaproteobacteria bacterium]|nr:NAD(P)/FAD-dependent oxidoreductase [Deltaproteobacteria bacterium]